MQTEIDIRRAAARLGPGHKGRRESLSLAERLSQVDLVDSLWNQLNMGEKPDYFKSLTEMTDWRDRKAKLFEIGEYKDKNLNVTESDLEKLAENFDLPVPILIEHTENPLQLGYLIDVEAVGEELFGELALTPEADDLLRASGANSLSISVSRDFTTIHEVSIVSNPRVESARLFCHNFNETPEKDSRFHALELEAQADKMIREGRVAAAKRDALVRVLAKAKRHNFEAELMQLVDFRASRALFTEIAPSKLDRPKGLTAEEADFYRKHFEGLDLNLISKHKEASSWQH